MAIARPGWVVPAALIALAFIPVVAGGVRLSTLAAGAPAMPDNVRFVTMPIPVVIHIVGATIYSVLGAFQFAPNFRRRHPGWHRVAGRLLVASGLAVALSGIWMAQFYAIVPADHWLLHLFRLAAGAGMAASMLLGLAAALRRDIPTHQAWMRRAYAIGLGAGTQALVMLPAMLWGQPDDLSRALQMGLAWGINIAVAEWLIRRGRRPRVAMA